MTNKQAQAYAVIALKEMLREGFLVAGACQKLDGKMDRLFSEMTEAEAEEKANRILQRA
ncbi:MAG: hypothetical protein ACM3TR_09915 [Caulobacteraceae bacterium]